MSVRGPGWYLEHDRGGFVRYAESRLDALDLEANELARYRHAETLERMRRLGLHDLASRYAEPTPELHPLELHATRHPTTADYEAFEETAERKQTSDTRRHRHVIVDEAGSVISDRLEGPARRYVPATLAIR